MLLSHLKTCPAVQLTWFCSIFPVYLAQVVCALAHTLKHKAATLLDVATPQPCTLPSTGRLQSHLPKTRAKAFHWHFKLAGGVNVGGSSTDTCFSLSSLQADRNFQQNCEMDSCEHEYLKSWQGHLAELVCHSPWLKGCLAGWALQAGLCWRAQPYKSSPNNWQQGMKITTVHRTMLWQSQIPEF